MKKWLLLDQFMFSTLRPRQIAAILQHFEMHFREWKCMDIA